MKTNFSGIKFFALLLCLVVVCTCDHGLNPENIGPEIQLTGISGTITFQNWPPADSLYNLRIVAFTVFPPQSIVNELIEGTAYAYPAIFDTAHVPYNVDSFDYVFELLPGIYEYICVAQQYGPWLYTDWRAVGQYDLDSATPEPSAVEVIQDSLLENINIDVDFDNLPIQPF